MAAPADYVVAVHSLLNQTLQPDTATVKAAEEGLGKLANDPALVPALYQVLLDAPEEGVRQSAALGLQKRVPHVWETLPAEMRGSMKAKLLQLAVGQASLASNLRSSVAQVIGAIGLIELPSGAWPQLVPNLVQQIQQGVPEERVAALSLLYVLLDTLPVEEGWGVTEADLASLLSSTLADPASLDVRVLSVRDLGKLEETADSVTEQVHSLFPAMVQVLHQALEASHEQGVKQILEVLDLFFLGPAPGLTQYLSDLLEFYLSTAARSDVEEELREAFLNSAIWTVAHKSSRVQQLELAPRLLVQAMTIVTTDELDEDASNPAMTALSLIATMARDLAPTQVWPTLQAQLQKFASSHDPAYRSAGLLSLGACADGMSATLSEHLDLVWAVLEAGITDGEPVVQQAALACLSDLCEEMGSELVAHHETIMPALLTLIGRPETQTQAARALDLYLEYLETDDISRYLRPVMENLAGHLDSSPLAVRKTLIAAIGSAAYAAREEFEPYLSAVMAKLTPYLTSIDETDEEQVEFRAVTQDVVGTLAEAVEGEKFRPYFAPTMELAYNALSLEHPVLRESAYLFFGSVAKVYRAEFAPFLPKIVPKLLEALKRREGQHEAEEGDDEDWDEMPNEASSPIVAEKQAAVEAVGDLFEATQTAYAPYLQESAEALIVLLTHSSPDLRKTTVETLFNLLVTLYKAGELPPWKPGATVQIPVPAEVEQLVDAVMANVVNIWGDEANDLVAMQLCQSLADALEVVGPALIHKYLADVSNMAMSVLAKTSLPQVVEGDDEEHDEDSTEFETLYVKSAMDLVVAMADALGSDFSQFLPQLVPEVAKYLEPGRSNAERKAGLSTLGYVVAAMKTSITPFVQDLFPLLSRGLLDQDAPSRTAAIYAVGVLVQFAERDLAVYYETVLQVLNTSLSLANVDEQPSDLRAQRDNAAGCLARMVRKHPHALPLEQTLSLIFGALPMLEDNAEWTPVVQMCLSLLAANDAVAQQHVDGMLCIFADVLALAADEESPLDDELHAELIHTIRSLHTQIPAQVQAAGLEQYLV